MTDRKTEKGSAAENIMLDMAKRDLERKEEIRMEEKRKPEVIFYVQAAGEEYKIDDITAACMKDCADKTGKEAESMDVYINVDHKTAYYVADGNPSEEFKVAL